MTGLLAHQGGAGARAIAADLGVPVDTVRSMVRSVSAHAQCAGRATRWAFRMDPTHPPMQPTGSPLGDALDALGHAAAATARRVPTPLTAWQAIGLISADCCTLAAGRVDPQRLSTSRSWVGPALRPATR